MIEFWQFLDESRQQGGKRQWARSKEEEMEIADGAPINVKLKYRGWLIIPTIHAAAQSVDRRAEFELSDWKLLHGKAINALEDKKKKKNGDYLFYSRSQRQGYVVNVNYGRKRMRIITVLPVGRKNPKPGTTQMIIEGREITILEEIEVD